MLVAWLLCLLWLAPARSEQEPRGWLGRLVAYHKKKFIEDLARIPTPLTVTVEEAPAGFVNPPGWDAESALRLLALVEALDARPARRAIYQALGPTRRAYLPPYKKNSLKMFPSWSKHILNDFEYDMVQYDNSVVLEPTPRPPPPTEPAECGSTTPPKVYNWIGDDTVLYISNPVEARLPGARISVSLLKELLENRAKGLRDMPTTTRYSHSWVPGANKGADKKDAAAGDATPQPGAGNGTTEAGAAEDNAAKDNAAQDNAAQDNATQDNATQDNAAQDNAG